MRLLHSLALALFLGPTPPTATGDGLPSDHAACLHEARIAHSQHDLERQRELLEHAETLSGRPEGEAEAQRLLAVLDWKYAQREDAARERLLRATEGPEPGAAWLALARLEQAHDRFAVAREAATEAIRTGTKNEVRRSGRIALAEASVAEAGALRRRGEPARTDALREAHAMVLEAVQAEPGLLDPSRLLLRASILRMDGTSALLAWRSYYHVGGDGEMPNAIAEAGGELARLLPLLGTPEHRLATVEALRESHFHVAAALLALEPEPEALDRADTRVRDALAYSDFVVDLRKGVDEYYRRLALGRGGQRDLDRIVRDALRTLHEAVDEPGSLPTSVSARWEWLLERFGADGNLGNTAGYHDLHLGHVIIDDTLPVTQYGETADLRFVALDHMVSNGFQSWAWDNGAQHGGWAGPNTMWQVRPEYADDAINAWRHLHDEESLAEALEMIERESARDDERARKNPTAFLPGLGIRLQLQAGEALLDELAARGLFGEALRMEFIREGTRALIAYSIFAHEGRHAIDKRLGTFDSATLEYRAKLSQVAFAPRPRLAVSGILSPNTGDATPHGQANARALKGVVAWMDEHGDEIAGLDHERPLLPQLDLLTDDQLRAAFRSMDPLARQ